MHAPPWLTDLQKILPREFKRRLLPRSSEPDEQNSAGQAARFVVQQNFSQILGRLIGKRSGVRVGHGRLARDRATRRLP